MGLTAYVTGASGFVGSHVARQLHEQGWTVHVLARSSSSLDELAGVPLQVHRGDVTDAASIRGSMPRGLDAVFHVAASTNFWSRCNDEQTRINVEGTRNMAAAAAAAGAQRFIHTSSFVTWGFPVGEFDEDTPRSDAFDWINYVRTKHLSEQYVLEACAAGRLDVVVLNPANVLGPGDWHNWSRLFRMVDRETLPGAPSGGGNYCDVREVARAHLRAFHDGRRGARYLLGGEFAKILWVIQLAGEILGKPTPHKPTPAWLLRWVARLQAGAARFTGHEPNLTPEGAAMASQDLVCSSARAESELGYRAVPIADMVRDTIDWMRSRGLLA
jgi:nucleoside-diphosphate-sugar epimerase